MPTGTAWDVSKPKKPWTEIDPEEILDYPIDWSVELAAIGATIATESVHDVSVPMLVVQRTVIAVDTKVLVRVRVDAGAYVSADHLNKKWPITFHMVATDGQEFEQTLWFKIVAN